MPPEVDGKDTGAAPEPNNPQDSKDPKVNDADIDYKKKFLELENAFAGVKQNSDKLLKEKIEAKAKKKEAEEKEEKTRLEAIETAKQNNEYKALAEKQNEQLEAQNAKYKDFDAIVAENEQHKSAAANEVKELTDKLTDEQKAKLVILYADHEKSDFLVKLKNLRNIHKIFADGANQTVPIGGGGDTKQPDNNFEKAIKDKNIEGILSHLK